jgi:hypothetical protein
MARKLVELCTFYKIALTITPSAKIRPIWSPWAAHIWNNIWEAILQTDCHTKQQKAEQQALQSQPRSNAGINIFAAKKR